MSRLVEIDRPAVRLPEGQNKGMPVAGTSLLHVKNIFKQFPLGGGLLARPRVWVRAVDDVSFRIARGEIFGLVGESGCGKTTLGRLILRLIDPTSGSITLDGEDITHLSRRRMRPLRRKIQMIFQDSYAGLDPRMMVEDIICEPLRAFGRLSRGQRRDHAAGLLEKVGLQPDDLGKYPHAFSGGQRQRIGIARALCIRPELIVADEPLSALDVSIQAQILNLLEDLKNEFRLSYLFISHNLSVVQHICERIAVMYLGAIVEIAPAEVFDQSARHPYSRALLSAVPVPDPDYRKPRVPLEGDVPSAIDPPAGCAFHTRCRYASDMCRQTRPPLKMVTVDHFVACWYNDGRGIEPHSPEMN